MDKYGPVFHDMEPAQPPAEGLTHGRWGDRLPVVPVTTFLNSALVPSEVW